MKPFLKKNYIHIFFIFFLFFHYVFSLAFVGQIILDPFDFLEITGAYDHIIGNIYNGNIESLNTFLSGEIKWFYIERLFYPINFLHLFLNDKFFYFTNDILYKIIAYYSFFLLGKSLFNQKIIAALGALLYATILFKISHFGYCLPFLPYILYLLLNKNVLKNKHYIVILLIGLNMSVVRDVYSLFLLIPISFILIDKKINLKIYLQVFSLIFFSSIIVNLHLIIGSTFFEPIHRISFYTRTDLLTSFLETINFLTFNYNKSHPLYYFDIPLNFLFTFLFALGLLSKDKSIKLISYFLIAVLLIKSIFGSNIMDYFFSGIFEVLSSLQFTRIDRILPLAFSILFLLFIKKSRNFYLKNILFFLCFFSILSIQLKTPLPIITKYQLQNNLSKEKFIEVTKNVYEKDYVAFFNIIFNKKNYINNEVDFNNSIERTYNNYFKLKDYAYIKEIVKDSRVMSVGLDPMIAVVNNIKVIDGYHTVYPLSYKIKFRKIIENELEKNIDLKNYYDNWGNRVYAFYNDQNNIMINFLEAKIVGADYVISKFLIKNSDLQIICKECNNSKNLFLYKIL